jgi:rfaE bifunctional protein kinase chain/domain
LNNITEIFDSFNKIKALVVGDVMIDAYYYGSVDRISPEAPVPIVAIDRKEHRLGGAANVALNLLSLGATPILFGTIGNDIEADLFLTLMEQSKLQTLGIVKENNRPTTVKTRIIGNKHQVLRVDSETTKNIELATQQKLKQALIQELKSAQVLIFEDYNKGVLSEGLISEIIAEAKANNVPIVVDPKLENFFAFKEVDLFKPNKKEVKEGLKTDLNLNNADEVKLAMTQLISRLNCKNVMITLSEQGVLIGNKEEAVQIAAHQRKIVDVSGAGDTVISVAALCVALKLNNTFTAELSNMAGGLVCEKLGVVPIDKALLFNEATSYFIPKTAQ